MGSLAARLEAGQRDIMGAAEARAAAEALTAAAETIMSVAGQEDSPVLVGALRRLTEATAAVEELCDRQLSVALVKEAGYVEGYEAGLAARALRAVR